MSMILSSNFTAKLWFVILQALTCGASSNRTHWVFVHYHKTGHHLARRMADVFRGGSCNGELSSGIDRRIDVKRSIPQILRSDITILTAPDMQVPWNASLLRSESNSDSIRLVRDPVEMVISAYLYHSQVPAPLKEVWLSKEEFNPCHTDVQRTLDVYGRTVGEYHGNGTYITDLIRSTMSLCHGLYNNQSAIGYNQILRVLSVVQGLQLEAARSLLSKSGGDILKMATNAFYESATLNSQSLRVFMEDFPVGNKAKFVMSSANLFRFLMAEDYSGITKFWSCSNTSEAVERSVAYAYIASSEGSTNSTKHVTQGMVAKEEREKWRKLLQNHNIFGPLFYVINEILLVHNIHASTSM